VGEEEICRWIEVPIASNTLPNIPDPSSSLYRQHLHWRFLTAAQLAYHLHMHVEGRMQTNTHPDFHHPIRMLQEYTVPEPTQSFPRLWKCGASYPWCPACGPWGNVLIEQVIGLGALRADGLGAGIRDGGGWTQKFWRKMINGCCTSIGEGSLRRYAGKDGWRFGGKSALVGGLRRKELSGDA
jgi:hypothetical protein